MRAEPVIASSSDVSTGRVASVLTRDGHRDHRASLENRYGPDSSIEGSNPSPSADSAKTLQVTNFAASLRGDEGFLRSILSARLGAASRPVLRESPVAGTSHDRKPIARSLPPSGRGASRATAARSAARARRARRLGGSPYRNNRHAAVAACPSLCSLSPSSTKNAVAAARSSTTMPTCSI